MLFMISEKQIEEIRKELKESENPLFFFDDDPDGLCSYLLLRKYIGKGKGVVAKGSATLDVNYIRKIEENSPDKIFVLDKPIISQEFIDKANRRIIWIDHHPIIKREGVKYYNPRTSNNENICASYLCYKIIEDNEELKEEDLWIAAVGIIADWGIPVFFDELSKRYPDLIANARTEKELLYESEFGKLIKIFSYLLKGKTGDVNKHINILLKMKSPYEILKQESTKGRFVFKTAEKIGKAYNELLEKALKIKADKLFVFTYPSGKISFTGELSNELLYKFPGKIILIGREKDGDIRFSLRSDDLIISNILEKALVEIEGYGGGHEFACGGNITKKDWKKFVENLKKEINPR